MFMRTSELSRSRFCQTNRAIKRRETAPAWKGWKRRARAIRRKSSKKNNGDVAEPVEKTSKRVMVVKMIVESMPDMADDCLLVWNILETK